ncbi:NACHT domain-containing protein [Sphingomonas sp. GC_Shp_3]|uniref:NACHT N-terminal Helical domain 1-containing protein n=1 Tax=Sphingomonas sp. GC_Shp_3 TaxID=2937383 RepID=UPI00226A17D2|nr:NACHT domain-containing protein [Sphingomonas sp. GC_Shp_3]
MEPVTTILGYAVGKAVFKAWFKDNEFASSASETAADWLKTVITDRRARGAAERQLARISESASDVLEAYIRFEWATLPDEEKIAAINVVQNTIDQIDINSSLMAALDFNTDRLTALISGRLIDGGLTSEGQKLAKVLASEAAQLISDLVSSFPEFHRDTFAEVLKREAEMINKLDRVFDEVKSIREVSIRDSSDAAYKWFEENYRRSIARELDRIELFGLDSGLRQSSRQHSLSTAYISLNVSGGIETAQENEETEQDSEGDNAILKKLAFSVRAEEAANLSKLVVIKGEAGSGKTTLLQSLAVRCATASFEAEMDSWNQLIPFFVRLRALTGSTLPAPEDLPALVAPMISGTMPSGWVHQQLRNGRGLVLIDGLDEVSYERREATRKWVESILNEFQAIRVVVTSRPTAIPDGWLTQKGFKQLELLPMSPDDVAVFIEHWHEAVAGEEQDLPKRTAVMALIAPLKERIRVDRALRELAGTPLLCAMLCAMNRDRKQVLPNNRIALYDAAVQMILHGRDEERRIKVESIVRLDFETKQSLIQEIAFWMMQNGTSMADQWRIEDFVSSIMPAFTKLSSTVTSKEIVAALIQRSGLIRSPVEGKVDFVHNAFKEYLCAKAVTAADRFGFLQSVIENEAWREVAVLAVAMTDERRRAEFITSLLEAGDTSGARRATFHLLAVRCLETCTQLDPILQLGIKNRLASMSAPSTFTEARSLSAAGELALPLLKYGSGLYARTAASCVRALRLIGTPEALRYIADFAPDPRVTVAKEVISAWPFFDAEEYAKEVLSQSSGVFGSIRIDYADYLKGIQYLLKTTGLVVALRRQVLPEWAMHQIASLRQLFRLSIYSEGSIDIRNIVSLQELRALTVTGKIIDNINDVSAFTNLQRLLFAGETNEPFNIESLPSSITFFGAQNIGKSVLGSPRADNSVREVQLYNRSPFDDFSYIQGFAKLKILTIHNIHLEEELLVLSKCQSLANVVLGSLSEAIETLEGLKDALSITTLRITGAPNLKDIRALSNLKNLKRLRIIRAPNLIDVQAIQELESLQELTLSISKEADLRFLVDSPNLKSISLGYQHQISELNGKPGVKVSHV